jgi:hypothetical protein
MISQKESSLQIGHEIGPVFVLEDMAPTRRGDTVRGAFAKMALCKTKPGVSIEKPVRNLEDRWSDSRCYPSNWQLVARRQKVVKPSVFCQTRSRPDRRSFRRPHANHRPTGRKLYCQHRSYGAQMTSKHASRQASIEFGSTGSARLGRVKQPPAPARSCRSRKSLNVVLHTVLSSALSLFHPSCSRCRVYLSCPTLCLSHDPHRLA